jgi:hypothetical protein
MDFKASTAFPHAPSAYKPESEASSYLSIGISIKLLLSFSASLSIFSECFLLQFIYKL